MKVLNLYAGIGGNRKLWTDVEVTAVEYKQEIADIYKDFFPNDTVIVTDAHQYLLEHYKEFDFIWASPPCPSHSRIRKMVAGNGRQNDPIYPDMKLYQEILFLQGYFKGKWIIENVISWYEPLIKPFEFGSHYWWSNVHLGSLKTKGRDHNSKIDKISERKGFNLDKYSGIDKKLILRNCVEPETGLHLLNMVRGIIKSQDITQKTIFD